MSKKWIPWLVVVALVVGWWWWTQKQKKAAAAAVPTRPANLIVVTGGLGIPTTLPGAPGPVPAPPDTAMDLQRKGYTLLTGDNGVQLIQGGKPYISKIGA